MIIKKSQHVMNIMLNMVTIAKGLVLNLVQDMIIIMSEVI